MNPFDVKAEINISKSSSESEDAFASNPPKGLAAISDGVGSSFLPSFWAKLLVNAFCNANTAELDGLFALNSVDQWLQPLQDEWLQSVTTFLAHNTVEPEISNQLNFRKAASATFVGIQLNPESKPGKWRALIVGDSVLLHICDFKLIRSYLIQNPGEFKRETKALASYPGKSNSLQVVNGDWEPNDLFILASDAIGKWLLKMHELGDEMFSKCLQEIFKSYREATLEKFINNLRLTNNDAYRLELDDTSLLIISANPVSIHHPEDEPVEIFGTAIYPVPEIVTDIGIISDATNYEDINSPNSKYSFPKQIIGKFFPFPPKKSFIILGCLLIAVGTYLIIRVNNNSRIQNPTPTFPVLATNNLTRTPTPKPPKKSTVTVTPNITNTVTPTITGTKGSIPSVTIIPSDSPTLEANTLSDP